MVCDEPIFVWMKLSFSPVKQAVYLTCKFWFGFGCVWRTFPTTENEWNLKNPNLGQNCGTMLEMVAFLLRDLGLCTYAVCGPVFFSYSNTLKLTKALGSVQSKAQKRPIAQREVWLTAVYLKLEVAVIFPPKSPELYLCQPLSEQQSEFECRGKNRGGDVMVSVCGPHSNTFGPPFAWNLTLVKYSVQSSSRSFQPATKRERRAWPHGCCSTASSRLSLLFPSEA